MVDGGITAARALRDQLLARRSRGEQVESNRRLRLAMLPRSGPKVRSKICGRGLGSAAQCGRPARHSSLGMPRLDAISPEDLAELVREEHERGMSE